METTIMGYVGIVGVILGLYWHNGKSNGNYYSIAPIMENQMEKKMENEMETGII